MTKQSRQRWLPVILVTMTAMVGPWPAHAQSTVQDLKIMSLEALLDLDVTTVSRTPEPTRRVPAAVYVITADDIRRSGAQSIPEALRLAPGMQVARINAGTWSVGTRGFADRLARSMLVLIDGRAVYSPLFAGTYWETQDTMLDDIERIEVIRGPGGTLWGANAVNGIINIITRSSRDTVGTVATLGGGSRDRAFATVRFGSRLGQAGHYRVYAKAIDRTAQFHERGPDYDNLQSLQSGFRADWGQAEGRSVMLQADIYGTRLGQLASVTRLSPPFTQTTERHAPLGGGSVLSRWSGPLGRRGTFQLQTSYARTTRDELPVGETRDTVDVDFQHTPAAWRRHQFKWGAGYRVTSGRITAVAPTEFSPARRTDPLYSGFAQDEITLAPDRLRLTLGSRIEHNAYSGYEAQPTARLLWLPGANAAVWGAVTRAVRTPSRVETDYTTASVLDPRVPMFLRLLPNPNFRPERLIAYEAGYRSQPQRSMAISATTFYNRLDNVLSTGTLPVFVEPAAAPVRVIVPVYFGNDLEGDSYGSELSVDARPRAWWRLTGNYSYVRIQLSRVANGRDVSQERRNEGQSPRHQVQFQSNLDLPGDWSVDVSARYISRLPAAAVAPYTSANLRIAWRPTGQLELAVVGQDILQARHVEWPGGAPGNTAIARSAYASLTWRH